MSTKRNWDKANRAARASGNAESVLENSVPTVLIEAQLLAFLRGDLDKRQRQFTSSLLDWIARRGCLTPKQEAAALRMMAGKAAPPSGAKVRHFRRARKPRVDASIGVTTYPDKPIEPYTGTAAPWEDQQ